MCISFLSSSLIYKTIRLLCRDMKEGRLQLWLYMFGVQNIGTAGILIDIVKESKQIRKDCLTRLYHLCCHRRDYKVRYNYQISWSKWFKIYTPLRTENVYDFSLIISRSFSVVVFNLFMQRQDFVFSATV